MDIALSLIHISIAQKLYNSLSKGVDTEVSDEDARVIHIQKIFVKSKESADAVSYTHLSFNGDNKEDVLDKMRTQIAAAEHKACYGDNNIKP